MPPKKPRLSLTKSQAQAGAGAELLSLCQAITADGVLTNDEISQLRGWLDTNRSIDLPAIGFLVTTLGRILADGKVTLAERKELHAAIEKVLPPEYRKESVAQRKAAEATEWENARKEREGLKQQEREERERRRPLYFMNFMVAGVHYEGRPEVIRRYVHDGDPVFLARDPGNAFSRNAIEVRLANGLQIGYVPEDYAPEAAPFLDQGVPHAARVTKLLRDGRVPIPVIQAYLYRMDADVEDLIFPHQVPVKRRYQSERRPSERDEFDGRTGRASGRGCLMFFATATVPAALVAARAFGALG